MRSQVPDNEKELLRRIARGDEAAYTLVFEKHWDAVFSTALVLTKSDELARDITQEVFTRIWVKRAEIALVDHLENYLFIMARNMIYSAFKREAVAEKYRNYIKEYFSETPPTPLVTTESRDLEKTLQHAIGQLPQQQQRVFRLSRLEGMKNEEIAREMGISINTVKSYLAHAMTSMRKLASSHNISVLSIFVLVYGFVKNN